MGKKSKAVVEAPKVVVHLRRVGRDVEGTAAVRGTYVLILNPKVFGSAGANWLGGAAGVYATKEAAIAGAGAAGATLVAKAAQATA